MTVSPISILDVNPQRCQAIIRLLRHDQSILREDDGAERFDDTMEELKESSVVLRNGQLTVGYLFRKKEEDQRKIFNTSGKRVKCTQ